MHILSRKGHDPVLILPTTPHFETDSISVVRYFAILRRCIKPVQRFMRAHWSLVTHKDTEEERAVFQNFSMQMDWAL